MTFKKNKYIVVRNAVSSEMCEFLYNYLLFKKQYFDYVKNNKKFFGNINNLGVSQDSQVDTYALYGSIGLDMFLDKTRPIVEKASKLKLVPTYSYGRIYKTGNDLRKHIDRKACEISVTVALGGDPWEIYVQDVRNKKKKVKLLLKKGDMAIYRGLDLVHWRTPFTGKECCQAFLHYNDLDGPYGTKYMFDGRPFLGAPLILDWSKI